MRLKGILLVSVILLLTSMGQAFKLDTQTEFNEANKLYESGETQKAFEIYQNLIRKGFSGSSLYYNLANLYYRRGERGRSILWYERARSLAPRDSDIQFNLKMARSHIKNIDENIFEKIIFSFTGSELSWIVSFFLFSFFILLGLVLLRVVRGELWPGVTLWSSGLLLILTLAWLGINLSLANKPWAVIISPPGEVRNGPGLDYAVGFTIPEGSKVLILNKRPKWTQVGVPQEGLKGWIQTDEISEIKRSVT